MQIIQRLFAEATGAVWPGWALLLFLAALVTAVLLFVLVRTDLRIVGVVVVGITVGIVAVALFLDFQYHIYIEASFGVRRMGRTRRVRTDTSCGARFLSNQRTEGTLTALTGRFALTEGDGPVPLVDKLPYVIGVMLAARKFYTESAERSSCASTTSGTWW